MITANAEVLDFLQGVSVVEYDGAHAEVLLREVFMNRQAQQAAFVALADCGLTLVPLEPRHG